MDPDSLNKGSYNFQHDLFLLQKTGKFQIVEGIYKLTREITLELVGGHSEGMQIVRLESDGELAYYAGDIIPTETHRHLAVNSAFDIDRRATFRIKERILTELKDKKGVLFYPHDIEKHYFRFQ